MKKVVLITGASSGIGEATARLFARRGYDVVIHYFTNQEIARALAKELKDLYHCRTLCVQGDVSLEADVKSIVESVIHEFGVIDVLVNNAGIAIDTDFSMKTVENFRRILDVNLIGSFLTAKYVSQYMKERGKGSIINVGSTNGIDSYYPYSMDYDASKAGLHILTKNLAVELAPEVRVNAVAPGWVATPMNLELDDTYLKEEEDKIVLGRFAEPIEIAQVIYFLASEEASYVNGSVLVADGGRK